VGKSGMLEHKSGNISETAKHYCVISILTVFTVIAVARTVNKNVSTGQGLS